MLDTPSSSITQAGPTSGLLDEHRKDEILLGRLGFASRLLMCSTWKYCSFDSHDDFDVQTELFKAIAVLGVQHEIY